jgi:hypothetical protein
MAPEKATTNEVMKMVDMASIKFIGFRIGLFSLLLIDIN